MTPSGTIMFSLASFHLFLIHVLEHWSIRCRTVTEWHQVSVGILRQSSNLVSLVEIDSCRVQLLANLMGNQTDKFTRQSQVGAQNPRKPFRRADVWVNLVGIVNNWYDLRRKWPLE